MSSSRVLKLILILPIFLHLLITPNHADPVCTYDAEYCWDCSDVGSYSANSVYEANLDALLTSISSPSTSDQNLKGFYNTSFGQNADKVNAIALCRGDLTPDNCRRCLNESHYNLSQSCSYKKEAILWDSRCMLRYSFNDSILSVEEDEPSKEFGSPQSRSDPEQFNQKLKPLLDDLINKSAAGDSLSKYAQGSTKVPNGDPIYAVLQCTPDLSQKECNDCLQDASSRLRLCCEGKEGARILKPSCNLRYESGPFLESDNTVPDESTSPASSPTKGIVELCFPCFLEDKFSQKKCNLAMCQLITFCRKE